MSRRKLKAAEIIGIILFLSLGVSVIYSFVRFLMAPNEIAADEPYTRVKSDYLLMITQCILGLAVMFLPSLISRRWKIVVPNMICILYYIFLYCAIFLGEVFEFYYIIPHWDTMLHAFSGAMLGALGFILVDVLNKENNLRVSLSPFFISLFAFSFALSVGALWEIYEFSFDRILGLNMQKYATQQGVDLVGAAALTDTMKDIIIDALAAFGVAVLGFFQSRHREVKSGKPEDQNIKEDIKEENGTFEEVSCEEETAPEACQETVLPDADLTEENK